MEIAKAVKKTYKDHRHGPSPEIEQLVKEASELQKLSNEEQTRLMQDLGITEKKLQALAASSSEPIEMVLERKEISDTPPSLLIDKLAPTALDKLRSLVDTEWLKEETHKQHRLTQEYLSLPIQYVGTTRIDNVSGPRPQRLAQMMLLCEDWINGVDDFDFHTAALLIPEMVMLSLNLDQIRLLGAEAVTKLHRLPSMPDGDMASTVHELLVGAGCLRKGTEVEMIKADRRKKSPDFRVHDYGPPTVIECKRRLGLSDYEKSEAALVNDLYRSIRNELYEQGLSVSLEVEFSVEVRDVHVDDFRNAVRQVIEKLPYSVMNREVEWGKIAALRLPYYIQMPFSRLYAPLFMEKVFCWHGELSVWDGIIAEVEPPSKFIVSKARHPRCLKWRCRNSVAVMKKSRGVTSLWGKAIQQIPPGEMGIVYISYPECNSPEIADERTYSIMRSTEDWFHYWWVSSPMSVIGRLYPRPLGVGNPDLIENALILTDPDLEDVLPKKYPGAVFTGSY